MPMFCVNGQNDELVVQTSSQYWSQVQVGKERNESVDV